MAEVLDTSFGSRALGNINIPRVMVKYPTLAESESIAGWLYRRDLRAACGDTVEIRKDLIHSPETQYLIYKLSSPGFSRTMFTSDKALEDLTQLQECLHNK
jgi:hypothetical protein